MKTYANCGNTPILLNYSYNQKCFREVVERIKTHILRSVNFFSRKLCRFWGNVDKFCRARQATADDLIRRWKDTICIQDNLGKDRETHSGYVIITAFLYQQCLRERATMLRYKHIACFVIITLLHLSSHVHRRDQTQT
jgi:hypothetical protein